jgi:DNA mismatch repair ATPase MutS
MQITLNKHGDFWECHGTEAKEVAKALDLVVTKDRSGIDMTAIPEHRLTDWTQQLKDKGYEVTLVQP